MSDRELPSENFQSPPADDSDRVLVKQSRAGDQNAATQIYRRYVKRLTALVRSRCSCDLARAVGVEDLVQSVFRILFKRIGQGFYDVPDGHELWRLLLVIAMNRIRSKAVYHRAIKRDGVQLAEALMNPRSIVMQEVKRESASDQIEIGLKETLERLPGENRLLVRLRIDGHTVAELATITGRSRRTVERMLQETRLQLTQFLRERGVE
jgi:RNA polymerase sigma-70 factor (ECF subfamily)